MTASHDAKRSALLKLFVERGFAFVHVPKTAGFAITHALLNGIATEHATSAELRQQLGDDLWKNLFTFGFTRDPASRFISAFYYLQSGGMNAYDASWARRWLSGMACAEDLVERAARTSIPLARWTHFRPQTDFLCTSDGLVEVSFVGRFESLERDYRYVAERLESEHLTLPVLNQGPVATETAANWRPSSRRWLRSLYGQDFATFGY